MESTEHLAKKRAVFPFDPYGIEGMKHFIVNDDEKIVGKTLKGMEAIDQKDKKLTLCKLKFLMNVYDKLTKNEHIKLSESAQDFFHLIHSFAKNEQMTNIVNVWMVEDLIQIPKTVNCGSFQIYIYKNIFLPNKSSKVDSYKKLTNSSTETLLNELFTLDSERKKQTINEYAQQGH